MLSYLGVDPQTLTLPLGLTVIQVGDLVHKGKDSTECVNLAKQLLTQNPGGYIQLVGNHEAHYLGGPDVTGRNGVKPIAEHTRETLQDWWLDGTLKVACSATTDIGPILVTHGGLTIGFHSELGAPTTPADAVEALEAIRNDTERIFRPGKLMTGVLDPAAGIICPRTGAEVYGPWLKHGQLPFTQVHGHEGLWWWPTDTWHDDVPTKVRDTAVVDRVSQQSWIDIGKHRLWSVDPVFGVEEPTYVPFPLVLPGRVDN